METSMVHWPCPKFSWPHCVLIALTIHGMTPDPRDVTSGSIARILQSILIQEISTVHGESPRGEDGTNEKPDQVCTPASSGAVMAEGRCRDSSDRQHRVSPSARTLATAHRRCGSSHRAVQTGRRLAALGRFTC
jgi:hypothetical protein